MKILVLRFSSIGDIVLTSPLVRCVKNKYPECQLHFATKSAYNNILQANPYIDKVHLLKEDINELITELDQEKFDLILDLHHNIRTQIIKFKLRVKSESVNKLNFEKWLLTQFKIDKLPKYKHIVERSLYTAKKMGVENDGLGLDYFIPEEDEVVIDQMFPQANKGFVVVVIGAKFHTKRLPHHKIIEICDKIDSPIILLGGLDDLARGEEIMRSSQQDAIFNACGKLNLNESASVIKQSLAVITHDTGLMHIAVAFNKNIVSIWGNTVPELGMYPYLSKEKYTIVQVENLSCRPCSKIGYKKCPKGHFDCMQKIDIDRVVADLNCFLKPV